MLVRTPLLLSHKWKTKQNKTKTEGKKEKRKGEKRERKRGRERGKAFNGRAQNSSGEVRAPRTSPGHCMLKTSRGHSAQNRVHCRNRGGDCSSFPGQFSQKAVMLTFFPENQLCFHLFVTADTEL